MWGRRNASDYGGQLVNRRGGKEGNEGKERKIKNIWKREEEEEGRS